MQLPVPSLEGIGRSEMLRGSRTAAVSERAGVGEHRAGGERGNEYKRVKEAITVHLSG